MARRTRETRSSLVYCTYDRTSVTESPSTTCSTVSSPSTLAVHGVGVAEEVVQVAQDLLVGPDQERGQVVGLGVHGVQLEPFELVGAVVEVAHDLQDLLDGRIEELLDARAFSGRGSPG